MISTPSRSHTSTHQVSAHCLVQLIRLAQYVALIQFFSWIRKVTRQKSVLQRQVLQLSVLRVRFLRFRNEVLDAAQSK